MAWEPKRQVVDLTQIVDNLLAYIAENDEDALAWVQPTPVLPEFAAFYSNASGRLATKFPQLIVLDQEHRAEEGDTEGGQMVTIPFLLTLEVALTGPVADTLVANTKKYALALESMLNYIPIETLTANSNVPILGWLDSYQTAFDQVKGYEKTASSWLQIFQTRVQYTLMTPI